jgi:hypothetical protein
MGWKHCVCAWQFHGGPPPDRQVRCDVCVWRIPTDDDTVYQERLLGMVG